MKQEYEQDLKREIQHIFDSGANEIRIFQMINTFIERRFEWISVKDRLPEKGVFVLCALTHTSMGGTKRIEPRVGRIVSEFRFSCEMDWVSVTHWVPLLEPPKE